jgi:hypothetical protein
MTNRKTIKIIAALVLCTASSVACGGSSKSAAETAPSKEMDSQQGGEQMPDGTSTADDAQQGSTHTMPDGTTMEGEDTSHE